MMTRTDILLESGDRYLGEDEVSDTESWPIEPEELAQLLGQGPESIKSISYNRSEGEVTGALEGGSEIFIEPEPPGYGIVFWDGEEEYFVSVPSEGDDVQRITDAIDKFNRGDIEPV